MTPFHRLRRSAANYNAIATTGCAYGYSHRSKLEASVCQMIYLRERAGELEHLGHEVHVIICGPVGHECPKPIQYIPDFKCRDIKAGTDVYIEAKGYEDPKWPMKKNMWRHYGLGPLEIWKGSHVRPVLDEIIYPIGI